MRRRAPHATRSGRPQPSRSSTPSPPACSSRRQSSRSSTAPLSAFRSVVFRALLHHVALRAAVAPVCGGSSCVISPATVLRAIHAEGSRVSQPLGTHRLWRPRRPRVSQPAWAAWRVGRAGRPGSGRENFVAQRRGGSRGTRPRVLGAATSWRDAGISSAGDAGGQGEMIGARGWRSQPPRRLRRDRARLEAHRRG